jgi:hypothetical protein
MFTKNIKFVYVCEGEGLGAISGLAVSLIVWSRGHALKGMAVIVNKNNSTTLCPPDPRVPGKIICIQICVKLSSSTSFLAQPFYSVGIIFGEGIDQRDLRKKATFLLIHCYKT